MPSISVSDEQLATMIEALDEEYARLSRGQERWKETSNTYERYQNDMTAIDATRAALRAPAQEGIAPNSHLLARQALLEILGFGLDSELDDAVLMLNAKSRIARIESEIDERRTSQPAGVAGLSAPDGPGNHSTSL